MNFLANDNELLKYIEIWNKIKNLLNKKFSKPVYNNEYMNTKINSYNENFHGNKILTEDKYYGHSILLLRSISEIEKILSSNIFRQVF